jgi:MFS family permease
VGVLTDLLNWRWVLFVNVPIGTLLLVGAFATVAEWRPAHAGRKLDLPGAITITGGLTALVYGIVNTDRHSWGSTATILVLALAVALLMLFVVIEARFAAQPLVPLSVFRRPAISAANAVAVTYGAGQYGLYIFFSLYLQQVNHYSPLKTGLAFLPSALATTTAALFAARIVIRFGVRRQLVLGLALTVAGVLWLSQLDAGGSYAADMLAPMILAGLGFGTAGVPMTMAATASMPAHEAGLASGLINTSRQVGGSVGLAAMATVAAAAAHPATASRLTTGYDRAFLISAATLFVGATLAALLPLKLGAARTPAVRSKQDPPDPATARSDHASGATRP